MLKENGKNGSLKATTFLLLILLFLFGAFVFAQTDANATDANQTNQNTDTVSDSNLLISQDSNTSAFVFAQTDANASQDSNTSQVSDSDSNLLISQDSNACDAIIQDQNLGTESWTNCSSSSPQKHCVGTSSVSGSNTFRWAFYNCQNAQKITEGTKCYTAGDTICTDLAYCPSGNCQFWYMTEKTASCISCEGGDCCSHFTAGCVGGDLYWFDSCFEQEEMKEDCRVTCNETYAQCVNGCQVNWNVQAFDLWRIGKLNASVQYDLRDGQGWQYAGQTDSAGLLNFTKVLPFNCGRAVDTRVISAEGVNCGEENNFFEKEDDTDNYFFLCPELYLINQLLVLVSMNKTSYDAGEIVTLTIHISDAVGNPVSGAFVGIVLPDESTVTAPSTNSSGNTVYAFTAFGEGNQRITVVTTKAGYRNGYREKRIKFEPINKWVLDSDGDGLTNAIEEKIGTDPYDPASNLVETVGEITNPAMCGFSPLGVFSNEDKQTIINELEAKDSIQRLTVVSLSTEVNQITFLEAAKNAEEMQIFEKKDGTIIVLSDEQSSQNFLFVISPACEGFYKGIAYGATQGITDDIALATGIAYYIIYSEDFEDFAYDIQPTVNSVFVQGTVYFFACSPQNTFGRLLFFSYCAQVEQDIGSMLVAFLFESIGSITVKADEVNTKYRADEFQKAQFVGSFTVGYIGGYWVEQIAAGKAISSIGKAGIKTAGKIASKVGPTAVNIMKNSKYSNWIFDLGEEGSIGIGRIAKARKTAGALDEFLSGMTKPVARQIGEKVKVVTNKLSKLGKTTTQIDDIWDTTSRTRLGKGYMRSFNNDELLGYAKFIDEFPDRQGNAAINVMKRHWSLDSTVKEAMELDDAGNFLKFYKEGSIITKIGDKYVDGVFIVRGKEFFVESTQIIDELVTEKKLYDVVLSKSVKFRSDFTGDGTIVVRLTKGTSLTDAEIQRTLWQVYNDSMPDMQTVARVGLYDAKEDVVRIYSKMDWKNGIR